MDINMERLSHGLGSLIKLTDIERRVKILYVVHMLRSISERWLFWVMSDVILTRLFYHIIYEYIK